jgi:hypothetical protein
LSRKFILVPHLFSSYISGPFNFKIFNFDTNFIFFIFSVFFWEERELLAEFRNRERKLSLATIPTIKMVNFYVKWFHMTRWVWFLCFFTLKVQKKKKKTRSKLEMIFSFGMILNYETSFFCIFRVHGLI